MSFNPFSLGQAKSDGHHPRFSLSGGLERWIPWVLLVSLALVLWVNLGAHHLMVHTDEPRRALVALEMYLSDNWVTPTLAGEFYYNKPPLMNWLILVSYKVFGQVDEWTARVPSLLCLYALFALIFFSIRYQVGALCGWLTAFAFATNFRVLFFDSFLGMIDMPFSLLIYANVVTLYFAFHSDVGWRKWVVLSYVITAAAFLTKALPAIAFQGLTMMVGAYLTGRWRRFFSFVHVGAGLGCLALLGLYYWHYLQVNPGSEMQLLQVILSESTKRTVVRFGVWATLVHMVYFPIDCVLNFMPWSAGLGILFFREVRKRIFDHPFLRFALMVALVNYVIYWTSPEARTRYLFMFLPLVYGPCIYGWLLWLKSSSGARGENSRRREMPRQRIGVLSLGVLGGLCVLLLTLAAGVVPYWEQGRNAPEDLGLGPGLLAMMMAGCAGVYVYSARKPQSLLPVWSLIAVLVLGRLSYSMYLLPQRAYPKEAVKQAALQVGHLTQARELWILPGTHIDDPSLFYIQSTRMLALKYWHEPKWWLGSTALPSGTDFLVQSNLVDTYFAPANAPIADAAVEHRYEVLQTFPMLYDQYEIWLVRPRPRP